MPNQDEIMLHILKLVGEGAGMPLPSTVEAALRTRYYGWIDKKKDKVPTKPKEIWEAKEGHAIHGRLREVGRQLKEKHAQLLLSPEEVAACCLQVETTSECPHCPDPAGF